MEVLLLVHALHVFSYQLFEYSWGNQIYNMVQSLWMYRLG